MILSVHDFDLHARTNLLQAVSDDTLALFQPLFDNPLVFMRCTCRYHAFLDLVVFINDEYMCSLLGLEQGFFWNQQRVGSMPGDHPQGDVLSGYQ